MIQRTFNLIPRALEHNRKVIFWQMAHISKHSFEPNYHRMLFQHQNSKFDEVWTLPKKFEKFETGK